MKDFKQQRDVLLRDFVVLGQQHRGELVEVAMIEKRWVENGEIVNVAHRGPACTITASRETSRERRPLARRDLQGVHRTHRHFLLPSLKHFPARQGQRHVHELVLNARLDRGARIPRSRNDP